MTIFDSMRCFRTVLLASMLILVCGLPNAFAADDLKGVLARLDTAAAKFKSAQADVVTDIVQTEPLPDDDKSTGTVLFERKGSELEMALHIKTDNGQPVLKDLVFAGGVGQAV